MNCRIKPREDSQIDFATGNVFCTFDGGGGGVFHKNIFQILAAINSSSREIARKTLAVAKKEVYSNRIRPNKSCRVVDSCQDFCKVAL